LIEASYTKVAGVALLLFLEAGCICNIQQLEITHICNKKLLMIPTPTVVYACLLLGLEIGSADADDCVGCEASGTG
jgi:hypothetical protein